MPRLILIIGDVESDKDIEFWQAELAGYTSQMPIGRFEIIDPNKLQEIWYG